MCLLHVLPSLTLHLTLNPSTSIPQAHELAQLGTRLLLFPALLFVIIVSLLALSSINI
jgi:hypothetical protein